MKKAASKNISAASVLRKHFGELALESLITASRTFPVTSRVDLQRAVTRLFAEEYQASVVGVHAQYTHETLTVAHLLREDNYPVVIGPLQHDEIEIGEVVPARCLRQGLWLGSGENLQFVVLLTPAE